VNERTCESLPFIHSMVVICSLLSVSVSSLIERGGEITGLVVGGKAQMINYSTAFLSLVFEFSHLISWIKHVRIRHCSFPV